MMDPRFDVIRHNDEQKQPFIGRCRECGFRFTICYLPMDMLKAATLMKAAACQWCASPKVHLD